MSHRDETIYQEALRNGCSEKMAEALACRTMRVGGTDDQYARSNEHFSSKFGDKYAKYIQQRLKRRGITMGAHDDYVPYLAKFPGDPDAVIRGHGAKSQLKRAAAKLADAQERKVEQQLSHPVALAPDLVREKVRAIEREHPEVKRLPNRERAAIRRQIIEKHAVNPSV